jgi:DNA-binding transcriptional MerR regulator
LPQEPGVDLEKERGYSGSEACRIVGITYRQLDYWARTGLVSPSLRQARGSGTRRLYSYRDLVALRVVKRLLDAGLTLPKIRRAVAYLRQHFSADPWEASLVLNGSMTVLVRNGEQLIDIVRGGQGVLNILPLSSVVRDVDLALAALRRPLSYRPVLEPENLSRLG